MTCWCGSGSEFGSGSCYFRHRPSKTNKKLIIFIQFFYLKLFEGTLHLHHISKIKSPKEVTNHRIRIFLALLDPDQVPLVRGMDPDPGHALDPDPDPAIIKQI
jgi:hypothetical protein